jgi:hypothetical protein
MRHRRHAQGDHSLCTDRCRSLNGHLIDAKPPQVEAFPAGRCAEAVARHLSHFSFREGDPRGVETVIAVRLAEALDKDGRPGVARELQAILNHIGTWPDEEADALDELAMNRHVRRAAELLRDAGL